MLTFKNSLLHLKTNEKKEIALTSREVHFHAILNVNFEAFIFKLF